MTFFVYICEVDIKDKVMNPNQKQSDVLFINRLTNVVYRDGEILETIINKRKNDTIKDNYFTKRAKSGIKNREISRLNRTRIFGLARDIMLKIGKMLEDKGYIKQPDRGYYILYI